MKTLLNKYSNCDTFSLTCPYNDGFSIEHPYGIYHLEKKLGEHAFKEIQKETKKMLQIRYDKSKDEINNLPSFEVIYEDIKNETLEYYRNFNPKMGLFICDNVRKKLTKYHTPESFYWHFYHSIGLLCDYDTTLKNTYKNTPKRDLDAEFNDPKYSILKPYIKKIDVTFTWHCTTTTQLHKVFYIELNNTTKQWLEQFDSPFDITGLEDLALYQNNNLKYSCCTHEEMDSEY